MLFDRARECSSETWRSDDLEDCCFLASCPESDRVGFCI